MKKTLTIMVILLCFFLVSCEKESGPLTQTPTETTQPEQAKTDASSISSNQNINQDIKEQETEPVNELKGEINDPIVKELLAKSEKIKSYKYNFKFLKRENSYTQEVASYTLYAKGNKIKKVYPKPKELRPGVSYNEVFLDTEKKKAWAVCNYQSTICNNLKDKAFEINYETEMPQITPFDILNSLPKDLINKGEQIFDSRKNIVVKYFDNKGNPVEVYIDKYYGFPTQQIVYQKDSPTEIITNHIFSQIVINNILESEVTLPPNYIIS